VTEVPEEKKEEEGEEERIKEVKRKSSGDAKRQRKLYFARRNKG